MLWTTESFALWLLISEPGVCCGKEDSRRNETQILEKYIFRGKKLTSIHFSIKFKMMDPCMQIEGTKLISIMNFRVQDFFRFAPRMPQIAQIIVSTFNIFPGGGGGGGEVLGGGGEGAPRPP